MAKNKWSNELLLIYRNRRARENFILNHIIVLAVFVPQLCKIDALKYPSQTLLLCILITGIALISQGQFFVAWKGSYFQFLLLNSNWINYIQEKLYFMASAIFYLLIIEVIVVYFYNYELIPFLVTASLINLGSLFFLLLGFAYKNSTKINLQKTIFFNSSGAKGTQFLIIFGTIGLFVGFFTFLASVFNTFIALSIVGFVGLFPLFIKKTIMHVITKKLKKEKYRLLIEYAHD